MLRGTGSASPDDELIARYLDEKSSQHFSFLFPPSPPSSSECAGTQTKEERLFVGSSLPPFPPLPLLSTEPPIRHRRPMTWMRRRKGQDAPPPPLFLFLFLSGHDPDRVVGRLKGHQKGNDECGCFPFSPPISWPTIAAPIGARIEEDE